MCKDCRNGTDVTVVEYVKESVINRLLIVTLVHPEQEVGRRRGAEPSTTEGEKDGVSTSFLWTFISPH